MAETADQLRVGESAPHSKRHWPRIGPTGLLALAIVGGAGASVGQIYHTSHQRWARHTAPVHADASQIAVGPARRIPDADVMLAIRDDAGVTRHVMARKSDATRFATETLAFLDAEQTKINAELSRDIAALVEIAFADRDQSVEELADWNYAMGRSWRVLFEAVAAAVTHIPTALVSKETIEEAVRHEVEAYFMRHYTDFVLKPEIRDPVLVKGLEAALQRAHASYLRVVANVDLRLQLFLAGHTELLDAGKAAEVHAAKLDWDAQAFKAPRFGLEDQAMRALFRGTQFVGVAALVAKTVGPALEAQLVAIFSAMGGRVMAALAPQLKATVATTLVGGPLAGWLGGTVVALGADWLVTSSIEHFERPQFVEANRAAVASTMAVWRDAMIAPAQTAVVVWFADSRAVVAAQNLSLAVNN